MYYLHVNCSLLWLNILTTKIYILSKDLPTVMNNVNSRGTWTFCPWLCLKNIYKLRDIILEYFLLILVSLYTIFLIMPCKKITAIKSYQSSAGLIWIFTWFEWWNVYCNNRFNTNYIPIKSLLKISDNCSTCLAWIKRLGCQQAISRT